MEALTPIPVSGGRTSVCATLSITNTADPYAGSDTFSVSIPPVNWTACVVLPLYRSVATYVVPSVNPRRGAGTPAVVSMMFASCAAPSMFDTTTPFAPKKGRVYA